jgi:hypothetical protein
MVCLPNYVLKTSEIGGYCLASTLRSPRFIIADQVYITKLLKVTKHFILRFASILCTIIIIY